MKAINIKNVSEQKQIDTNTVMAMIVAALAIDGTQALLTPTGVGIALNPLIGAGAGFFFNNWFSSYNIKLLSRKNAGLFMGTVIAEFLPILNSLPLWTGSVIITLARNHKQINRTL